MEIKKGATVRSWNTATGVVLDVLGSKVNVEWVSGPMEFLGQRDWVETNTLESVNNLEPDSRVQAGRARLAEFRERLERTSDIDSRDRVRHYRFGDGTVERVDRTTYSIPMAVIKFDNISDTIIRPVSELEETESGETKTSASNGIMIETDKDDIKSKNQVEAVFEQMDIEDYEKDEREATTIYTAKGLDTNTMQKLRDVSWRQGVKFVQSGLDKYAPGKVDEDKWDKAKKKVKEQKDKNISDFSDRDWGLVNHIYQNMGGVFGSVEKRAIDEYEDIELKEKPEGKYHPKTLEDRTLLKSILDGIGHRGYVGLQDAPASDRDRTHGYANYDEALEEASKRDIGFVTEELDESQNIASVVSGNGSNCIPGGFTYSTWAKECVTDSVFNISLEEAESKVSEIKKHLEDKGFNIDINISDLSEDGEDGIAFEAIYPLEGDRVEMVYNFNPIKTLEKIKANPDFEDLDAVMTFGSRKQATAGHPNENGTKYVPGDILVPVENPENPEHKMIHVLDVQDNSYVLEERPVSGDNTDSKEYGVRYEQPVSKIDKNKSLVRYTSLSGCPEILAIKKTGSGVRLIFSGFSVDYNSEGNLISSAGKLSPEYQKSFGNMVKKMGFGKLNALVTTKRIAKKIAGLETYADHPKKSDLESVTVFDRGSGDNRYTIIDRSEGRVFWCGRNPKEASGEYRDKKEAADLIESAYDSDSTMGKPIPFKSLPAEVQIFIKDKIGWKGGASEKQSSRKKIASLLRKARRLGNYDFDVHTGENWVLESDKDGNKIKRITS